MACFILPSSFSYSGLSLYALRIGRVFRSMFVAEARCRFVVVVVVVVIYVELLQRVRPVIASRPFRVQ